jgi:hypothetical protein
VKDLNGHIAEIQNVTLFNGMERILRPGALMKNILRFRALYELARSREMIRM